MVRGRKSEKKNEPTAASRTPEECKEPFDKNRFLILPSKPYIIAFAFAVVVGNKYHVLQF